MPRRLFRGPTIQAALILGFVATFGVWLFAGVQFARRVADLQRGAAVVNARYLEAQDILSEIRTQTLLGSVYVRDALLDPDPSSLDAHRLNVERVCAAASQELNRYVPMLGSTTERERLEELRQELTLFHVKSIEVLASDRRLWPTRAHALISEQITPRRDNVLQISAEIIARNGAAFVRRQGGLGDIYETTQQRIWQQLGAVLVVSLVIALAATIYVGRLENELQRRQRLERQTALDLERLSTKLVTAQEEERRLIARELHDEVGQLLMALKVELTVARRPVAASSGATNALDDAQRITDTALAAVRDLSRLLHPALLDDLGLQAAIEWYLGSVSRRHEIRTEAAFEGLDERFAPEIEAAFYRIVQEALTNVVKHARATTCRVHLHRQAESVVLTVEDDGVGFDASRPPGESEPRGLGLIGIGERVRQLGGNVSVESAPGRGTRIAAILPARPRVDVTERENLVTAEMPAAPEWTRG